MHCGNKIFKRKFYSFYIIGNFTSCNIKKCFVCKRYKIKKEGFFIKSNEKFKKIVHALLPLIIGGIVGIITSNAMDYNDLLKPTLSPPAIVFPIAWTIIYLLIGISYTLLKEKGEVSKETKQLYYVQLFFNYLWTFLFFVFELRLLSVLWIIILDVLVICMTYQFYKQNKLSGILLIPYVLWLIFATYLNISIYFLNL